MTKKNLLFSIIFSLLLCNGIFAFNRDKDIVELDVNNLDYIEIEEESEIDLGFDTADYLPEDFDPYAFYFDLNSIEYMENDEIGMLLDLKEYLPSNFNAYANPTDVRSINYIDVNDGVVLGFDTKQYLPKDFDPYVRK